MTLFDHTGQPLEEWRDGVVTKMRVSAEAGAHQLCIFDQWWIYIERILSDCNCQLCQKSDSAI